MPGQNLLDLYKYKRISKPKMTYKLLLQVKNWSYLVPLCREKYGVDPTMTEQRSTFETNIASKLY